MSEIDTGTLEATIRSHAAMLASGEWVNEHRPVLMSILQNSGLTNDNSEPRGVLMVTGRSIPVEAITGAIHDQFIERRTKALIEKLTKKLVADAGRSVLKEEDDDTRASGTG